MPLSVNIFINADDNGDFTPIEQAILRAVSLQGATGENRTVVFNGIAPDKSIYDAPSTADDAPGTGENPAEAEKPAEAPKRKRRTKAEIEADEAAKAAAEGAEAIERAKAPKADEDTAPSSESGDADLPAEETSTEPDGQPDGEAGPTVEEAVARAAKFMRDGRGPEAKAALDRVGNGAERVSKLNPKDVPAYMAALDELESL